jgi:hypothetical protein
MALEKLNELFEDEKEISIRIYLEVISVLESLGLQVEEINEILAINLDKCINDEEFGSDEILKTMQFF